MSRRKSHHHLPSLHESTMPTPPGHRQTSFSLTETDMRRLDHLLADLRVPKQRFIAQAVLSALEQSECALARPHGSCPRTSPPAAPPELALTAADDSPVNG